MILVDSGVWIDYFRGLRTPQVVTLDAQLGSESVLMGDIILAEVLQGFRTDVQFEQATQMLGRLRTISIAGRDLAVTAARNYRLLRARGITIRKTIDSLIATRCIQDDLPLLYSDRDFDPFVVHLGLISALP